MKERKSIYIILPLIALVLMSCQFVNIDLQRRFVKGSGNLTTETEEVTGIESVTIEDRGDLTIVQGEREGLTIEADDNILPYIRTSMRGGELRLEIADGYRVSDGSTIQYTLYVKDLNRVAIIGSGNVEADALDVDDLTLQVSGSGNMNIKDLHASKLDVQSSGSGNYTLEGAVVSQSLTINGAGNYMAGDLQSSEARINISGAGNATVWAEESLDIHISGFGKVDYYGSPKLSQTMAGGGDIQDLGKHK